MFNISDLPTLHRMQAIAKRVDAMKHERAVRAFCEAFGSTYKPGMHLDMCIIHNSLVGFENGKPWKEVNYSKMRLARRLTADFRASRLVTDWYRHKCGL